MSTLYLVTGGAGHLGNTIVHLLASRGQRVRALVFPGDAAAEHLEGQAQLFCADVRDKDSLRPFFAVPPGERVVVIHTAGVVSIGSAFRQEVHDVNVGGTRNVVELCRETGVAKLVYVSSVHAIPEPPGGGWVTETTQFDPEKVVGLYAKTKAEATRTVLEAGRLGLDVSVVHPSGLCGPNDYGKGHLTQLLIDYCNGKLAAGVNGGYDFVDVRDVAEGVIACCQKGRPGECYILSNRHYPLTELFEIFHQQTGRKPVKHMLPMWLAKATAPLAEGYYRLLRQPPLYTAYSLHTLSGNVRFSHEKADRELGYQTRDMADTVRDATAWLQEHKRI